jgi:hypothetical protein
MEPLILSQREIEALTEEEYSEFLAYGDPQPRQEVFDDDFFTDPALGF